MFLCTQKHETAIPKKKKKIAFVSEPHPSTSLTKKKKKIALVPEPAEHVDKLFGKAHTKKKEFLMMGQIY